jgi:predicted O-methyltransferase YrrM
MTDGQARMLFESAALLAPGELAVEIGSHKGKSSIMLASGMPAGAGLVAVDPFDDPRWGGGEGAMPTFLANLRSAGVADKVELERGLSFEVAARWDPARRIRLLYVDGAHDFETALKDLRDWERFLEPDATVLVHDAFSSTGVTRAVLRQYLFNWGYRFRDATTTMIRVDRGLGSVTSQIRLFGRVGYFARNVLIKLAIRRNAKAVVRLLGHPSMEYPY